MKVSHTNQRIGFEADYQPCLFSVHGNSREMRRKRIQAVAEQEPCLGFLAAVFDFEWMVRRAILALSDFPSPFTRKQMNRIHGTDGLKNAWNMFVCSGNTKRHKALDVVIREGTETVSVDWGDVCTAFKARHPIVHGDNGFIKDDVAKTHMYALWMHQTFLKSICTSPERPLLTGLNTGVGRTERRAN